MDRSGFFQMRREEWDCQATQQILRINLLAIPFSILFVYTFLLLPLLIGVGREKSSGMVSSDISSLQHENEKLQSKVASVGVAYSS